MQQNDQINKLLNTEKMRATQLTQELDERLVNEDELQQHVAEQAKKRLSDGNTEQNAVPASAPPNNKHKQNMSGKSIDADCFCAQLAVLRRQGDAAVIIQGMLTHSEHAGVQQQACEALTNLEQLDGRQIWKKNQDKIAEAGGIEAVVAAMKAHTTSVLVQDQACRTLVNLASSNDRNHIKNSRGRWRRGCCSSNEGTQVNQRAFRAVQPRSGALYSLGLNLIDECTEVGITPSDLTALKLTLLSSFVAELTCAPNIHSSGCVKNSPSKILLIFYLCVTLGGVKLGGGILATPS